MKQETFDWIWNELIVVLIDDILDRYKNGNSCICDFQLKYKEEKPYLRTKEFIRDKYEIERDKLKHICYGGADILSHSLDQHKIAACFCKIFVDNKLFVFRYDETTPDDMILINYYLAYQVSISIVYLYLEASYIKKADEKEQYIKRLYTERTLKEPASKHGNYHEVSVTTLAINDFYSMEFNLLGYAREMFWLEYYTRQVIEENINPPLELFEIE